jgi:hypothetical protein
MLCIQGTTESIEVATSAAISTDYVVSWVDNTASAFTPGGGHGNISTATTTTIVAAPGAATQRGIKQLAIHNRSTTTAQGVTVKKDVSATEYVIIRATLQPGDALIYAGGGESGGWAVYDQTGRAKFTAVERTGYTGRTESIHKSGSAADTIGYWYCSSKDGGFPGAWAVGTAGVAGRVPDGTAVADAGCVPFQNPSSGSMYLTGLSLWGSTPHPHVLFDVVWVNDALVVTTTTAQTVNSVAFGARDVNGSANGEGLMIGLLFTGTGTNAGAISNSTISYTNEQGTAGRTATLEAVAGMQIPITPLVGTIVWFKLQAGDKGVRSIQTITLGTSLGAGSISLLVARWVAQVVNVVAGLGSEALGIENPGVRLYNGSCLHLCYRASAVTATVVGGTVTMMER